MAMTLITTNTITSAAAASNFTSGIDSTYKLYIFKFIDMDIATGGQNFFMNGSIDAGSNYNVTKTTTSFWTNHDEDDTQGTREAFSYKTGFDKASSTGGQLLNWGVSDDADACLAGELFLFDPSNTTYVKQFYATTTCMATSDIGTSTNYTGGYFNTTDNIDAMTFYFEEGNITSGIIKMYGVG